MKYTLTTFITMIFSFVVAFSQISEGTQSMSQGSNNSFSLDIPEANEKIAKKVWKNYMKKETKGGKNKYIKKTGEFFADDVEYVTLGGSNTIDIYAKFQQVGENVSATVWYDLGGAYLSSDTHPDKSQEGQKFLMYYAIKVAVEMTKIELVAEEKKKRNMEKDLATLIKKKEGYLRDIENAKQLIREREAQVQQNIKDQEATNDAIKDQGDVVKQVKSKLEELEN
ncbi:MAG: hypothetical protein ACPG5P_02640 [Saprospiraceae bacterium]